jgi:pimeloyl-ACP methyl ester carboxylesterase
MELIVPVEGGEIWAEDREGSGTGVVLLHPGWGNSTIWNGVVERLPAEARVLRYDNRGFGRSPAPTVAFTALADLIAILDWLGGSGAFLVGRSGGGATAVSLALAEPERVRSMVLVASGLSDYPWPENDSQFVGFNALYAAGDNEELVDLALRTWAPNQGPEDESQIRPAVAAMVNQADYLLPDPPAFDRLHEVRVPTHVVIGTRNHPSVITYAFVVTEQIPGCRQSRIAGVDHLIPLRKPDLLAHIISDQQLLTRRG